MKKTPPPSEKQEERQIIDLCGMVGLGIIKFSQPHKASQTRGVADLLVLCPKQGTYFWCEVKRRQGDEYKKTGHGQTLHQKTFQVAVEEVGMTYILGSLSTVQEHLRTLGILR